MWPWILLGVVILFFGGCFALVAVVGSAMDAGDTDNPSASSAPGATAATAGIGQEVRDGKFAFTATERRDSTDCRHSPSTRCVRHRDHDRQEHR